MTKMYDYILFKKNAEVDMYECKMTSEIKPSVEEKYHCIDNRECEVYGFYIKKIKNIGEQIK
jgi:hypothetical protein